jgi:putative ABC transport system permease protein
LIRDEHQRARGIDREIPRTLDVARLVPHQCHAPIVAKTKNDDAVVAAIRAVQKSAGAMHVHVCARCAHLIGGGRGIYDGGDGVDKTQMFFRYDYLDENRAGGQGQVGWYIVKISDPDQAVDLSRTFDEMFANSSAETKTTTEKGFVEGFAKQIGDIGSIMIAISSTVLFMFGLVAASTMGQSVRERTSELAVLKTLGFSGGAILTLVLAESLFIAFTGGLLGLGLAWLFVTVGGDPTNGMLPVFTLPPRDVVLGVVLMVLMGVLAGVMPAVAAMRLKITDALRRT